MIKIQSKPWSNREDGRIIVSKNNKILFSKHYRDLQHRHNIIINIICPIL